MTPQEAIQFLKETKVGCISLADKQLREVCTIAIEAIEKRITMEHHHTKVDMIHDEVRISICPSCLSSIATRKDEYPKFCTWCGQALDWSDSNI